MSVASKSTWSKEAGYIWSLIGSAVGFANILSFSALCYRNGGGAFLIPYLIAHLLVGLPMLWLEGSIGQRLKLPLVSAMGKVGGVPGKFFGWLAVLTCATIGGFYTVLTGFSVAYSYFTGAGAISTDSAIFFKHHFLHDSGGLAHIGSLSLAVLIPTVLVLGFSWLVLTRHIQSGIEKLCSLFLPLLGLLVLIFAGASAFLPGSLEGFKHYLIPDFPRLADWTLWRDVFGQVFFSLSLGLGIVTGYSRHNPGTFNVRKAMIKVAIGDFIISFIAGFAIFGCIGFMSLKNSVPFEALVKTDSAFEIGFVIFPMILSQFGDVAGRILGPLFFFCVFIAGVTGVFSIVESIAGNIEVEFKKSRKMAVAISMGIVSLLALPFCMGNGQHLLGTLAPMVLGNVMLVGGITEIFFFFVLSKLLRQDDTLWMKGSRKTYPYYALLFFVLPLLTMSLFAAVFQEFGSAFDGLDVAVRWGWLALILGLCLFLARRKVPMLASTISAS